VAFLTTAILPGITEGCENGLVHEGSTPLAGLRVLELADPSAAFAGRLLALLGADVVMLEPAAGHALRGRPADFWWYAAGKRSVAVGDPTLARALARVADVVVAGTAPAPGAPTPGPDAVVVRISAFDPDGPRSAWRASDLIAQATGGMVAASGPADGVPLQAPGLQAYHQAGIMAAIGAVAGLLARERTSRACTVSVSLEAAVAAAVEQGADPHTGKPARRNGALHWTRLFHVGRGRDGHALHATVGDWTTLVEWMKADGAAADLADPAYEDPAVRQVCAGHVFAVVEAWARRYRVNELASEAQLRRLPFAAVRPPEALLSDAHLEARGFFTTARDPASGRDVSFPGAPFRLAPVPQHACEAPGLDEHREAVRHEWLERLRRFDLLGAGDEHALATNPARPLDGVRVLDFTWQVAGPTAARTLAALGAEIVKVEHPKLASSGARSAVDLTTGAGLAYARRLVASSDVVVDNFSARVMENLGLDYPALRALRPDVICLRMTGFGTTGPDRDHVSFGPTLQARVGFTALMEDSAGSPIGFGYSYSDLASGHLAALAVVAALWRRRRTGEGAFIDFSQLEALATLIAPLLLARTLDGQASVPVGNRSQEGRAAPHGVYPCAGQDEWLALGVFSNDDWRRLVDVMGKPPWTREPRFATLEGREAATTELDGLVAAWTRTVDAGVTAALLQGAGVAAGRVAAARTVDAAAALRIVGRRGEERKRPAPRRSSGSLSPQT
jgi:crotonobetainyl-CoA:carnitine CoA-transferase CaiB-like acyl-CoA transferase